MRSRPRRSILVLVWVECASFPKLTWVNLPLPPSLPQLIATMRPLYTPRNIHNPTTRYRLLVPRMNAEKHPGRVVHITKTRHVRSFLAGSGGPHISQIFLEHEICIRVLKFRKILLSFYAIKGMIRAQRKLFFSPTRNWLIEA